MIDCIVITLIECIITLLRYDRYYITLQLDY